MSLKSIVILRGGMEMKRIRSDDVDAGKRHAREHLPRAGQGVFWWWLTIVEGDYRMEYIGVPDSVPDVEFSR